MPKPNPQFMQSLVASLHYWQKKTKVLGPDKVQWLDSRRRNLFQAVQFGLSQPETWEATVQVLLQSFNFAEWRGYWQEWILVMQEALANAP